MVRGARKGAEAEVVAMMSCREASRLLSDGLDRPLRARERLALRLHLAMCRGCSRTAEHLRFIARAMSLLGRRGRDTESTRK